VLAADVVASAEYLLVRAPAIADLFRDLLLYRREGVLADAADPGGLVLDPEQYVVSVLDSLLL
jgi:hypothetical protein